MATGKPPTGTPMSKELACIQYSTSERVPVIEPSALDSSKDGVLFAVGVSKRVYVSACTCIFMSTCVSIITTMVNIS